MIKVLLKGPILTRSGYGEQARFAFRALMSQPDLFEIYIQPINWGTTSWISESDEERSEIDARIESTIAHMTAGGTFDMTLQVTIPNEWEAPPGDVVNIGYTAGIETTLVDHTWLLKGNEMDKIICVSEHSKNVLQSTQYRGETSNGEESLLTLTTPVDAVGYPVKKFEHNDLDLDLSTAFNFLSVAQWGPRKNLENMVMWFLEEFRDDDVGLILKTNLAKNCLVDREICHDRLRQLFNTIEDVDSAKCRIYLLHGDMSDEEIHSLYTHSKINAFVSLSHGEGFGLPIFEAAYSGMPIVTAPWSGPSDFLYGDDKRAKFYDVAYDLGQIPDEAVWEGVLLKESHWCYPREHAAKRQMRICYEDLTSEKKEEILDGAKKHADYLSVKFSEEALYQKFVNSLVSRSPHEDVDVADIPTISLVTSVYKAAEYIEQLMDDVTRQTIFEDKCEWIILNVDPPGEEFDEEVILKYVEKYPNNIIYKRLDEDPGIYDTWNMGIKMSTGDFVTNVNCDDRRRSDGLEQQAKLLVATPDASLVYNDSYVVHEPNIQWEGIPLNCQKYNFENFSKEAMLRGNLPHNNPMWRRELHDKFGYFNQHYKASGDWDFWLRCAFGETKFVKHPEVLGIYYFNPEGMSTNPDHDSWKKEHEREIFQGYLQKYQAQMSSQTQLSTHSK
tara:strand:- start:375 stop:2387 length:2013 start_codon:yes stop_codon:yes gene_type:complete